VGIGVDRLRMNADTSTLASGVDEKDMDKIILITMDDSKNNDDDKL
jgi:hypothetical protein